MWFNAPSELWKQYAERALELRKQHMSFTKIAAIISQESGQPVNRNMVAGRLHRDGAPPIRNHGGGPRKQPLAPARINTGERLRHMKAMLMTDTQPITFRGILIDQLERQDCRFIVSGKPTRYCGNPKADGFSYCAFHTSIAYIAPPRRHAERLGRMGNVY